MVSGIGSRREINRSNQLGQKAERDGDLATARQHYEHALRLDTFASQDDWNLLGETPKVFRQRLQIRNMLRLRLSAMARAAKNHQAEYVRPADWSPKVFVYWGQGFYDAPDVVKFCNAELHRHHSPEDIVTLTDANLSDWADIPDDIQEVLKAQNRTAFSDVLRFEVLAKHGGIWVDATCLTTARLQDHFEELTGPSGFFAFANKGPLFSSWLIASEPGSYMTHLIRDSLRLYWRVFDRPIAYFYLHYIFRFLHTLDARSAQIWSITPRTGYDPRTFGRILTEQAADFEGKKIAAASIVHKLSYKFEPAAVGPDTVLHSLIRGEFLNS